MKSIRLDVELGAAEEQLDFKLFGSTKNNWMSDHWEA
jgi:hypothetical protein